MRLTFETAGVTLIDRDLQRVGAYAGDVSPALHVVVEVMRQETKEQFATEGGHASGGWAQLAPATVLAKHRGGYRPEILRRTDALMRSLTIAGDENEIVDIQPQALTFGSSLPYAAFHQVGTSRMPARPPLAFTETAKRRIVKVIQRYIVTGELG